MEFLSPLVRAYSIVGQLLLEISTLLLDSLCFLWLWPIGLCSLPRKILGLSSFFSHISNYFNNWRQLLTLITLESCSYQVFDCPHLVQPESIWLSTVKESVFVLTSHASWNESHPISLPSSFSSYCDLWVGLNAGRDVANVVFIHVCVYIYICLYMHTYIYAIINKC